MKISSRSLESLLDSPVRLRLFFLFNLPMALLAGLRVESANEGGATVSLPYRYLTKNPFRSIYFACQAMAAEFSTAIALLSAMQRSDADFKLIVTQVEGQFQKKAKERISFTCPNGNDLENRLRQYAQKGIGSDEPLSIQLESRGRNGSGETVSVFKVTWAVKK